MRLTKIRLSPRLGVALLVATPFLLLDSGIGATSSKPPRGKIVFTVSVNSSADLYLVVAKGSQPRQLTHDRASELDPVWSPDGRSIAYVKDGLYRMPATGGRPRLLLGKSSFRQVAIAGISDLSWSPDGRRFAFTAASSIFSTLQLWTYGLDGALKRVTQDGSDPTWSPTGRRIAFNSQRGIFTIRLNGRGARPVPGTTRADSAPVWSPNGRWIAVRDTHTDVQKHQVDSLDILSPVRRLRRTLVRGPLIFPAAWSPNGMPFSICGERDPYRPARASSLSFRYAAAVRER